MPATWNFENPLKHYALALLAVAISLLIRTLVDPILGESSAYLILFPAIVFSALFCGVGPSLVAIVAALAGTRYWFMQPAYTFALPETPQLLAGTVFLAASAIAVIFCEISRRTAEKLREAQSELEAQVGEQTLELGEAHEQVRGLTGQVLHLQDDERRRIARELHDSVGQYLAALGLNLATVKEGVKADIERLNKTAATLTDSTALVHEMTKEIRTISYLLHPPFLDEAGLVPALKWYVQGFSERSKIAVDLQVADSFERLATEVETTIFRVVQECLTNIHRHSGSSSAEVQLEQVGGQVEVRIRDQGKGITEEKLAEMASSTGNAGVGMRGMRERVRQLGGTLEMTSEGAGKGALVVARLPVTRALLRALAATTAGGASAFQ